MKVFLSLMTADVHHLKDSEFVGEVHIGNATTSGVVDNSAVVAKNGNWAVFVLSLDFTLLN